jgi:hypothetical protein
MWRKANEAARQRGRTWHQLRAVPELARCSDAAIDHLDDIATEVTRPAGAIVEAEGHLLRQMAVVLDGTLVERQADGHELPVSGLVGIEALRGARVAASTVVATTPVRLLVFGPLEIDELVELVRSAGSTGIRAAADGARVPVVTPRLA